MRSVCIRIGGRDDGLVTMQLPGPTPTDCKRIFRDKAQETMLTHFIDHSYLKLRELLKVNSHLKMFIDF